MENKPSIDPGILVPAILGLLSLAGIAVIFFFGRQNAVRPADELPATNTPFRYVYLGTEPGLLTFTVEPTMTQVIAEPGLTKVPEPTRNGLPPPISTPTTGAVVPTQPLVERTALPTLTLTPTISPTIPATLAKYDDTYYAIIYDGEWTAQANVTGAYQNTLHISFEVENYAYYTFVGQQVIVGFQAAPSLGILLIDLDGIEFEVSLSSAQTQLIEWRSPVLVMGAHEIIIEHLSGGSVNIDSITIPDLGTATPDL